MKPTVILMLATLALLVSAPATAGRFEPVQDLTDVPVTWIDTTPPTLEQVGLAIVTGCATRGWSCRIAAPGAIEGTIHVRDHRADVRITYDTEKYAIHYAGSDNLRYDAAENTIHRNYNRWVVNLRSDINAAMANLSATIAATRQE